MQLTDATVAVADLAAAADMGPDARRRLGELIDEYEDAAALQRVVDAVHDDARRRSRAAALLVARRLDAIARFLA